VDVWQWYDPLVYFHSQERIESPGHPPNGDNSSDPNADNEAGQKLENCVAKGGGFNTK